MIFNDCLSHGGLSLGYGVY